jgi:tRNA U55 pseudouridine synthase TruB
MDGLLLVDNPARLTSHNIVAIVRKRLNIKKVGHAGTLDPLRGVRQHQTVTAFRAANSV